MTAQKTPAKTVTNYRLLQTRATVAVGAGLVALIIGVAVGHFTVGISGYGSVSALQANQLCSTGIGSLVQGFDSTVSSACSTAGTVASIHGALVGFGWFFLIVGLLGIALAVWGKSQNAVATPATLTAPSQPSTPFTPSTPVPPQAGTTQTQSAFFTPEVPDTPSADGPYAQ